MKKEELKVRIQNLLVITMERKDIQLMYVGVRVLNQNAKPKSMDHYQKCNKQGHQTHECRNKTMNVQKFEGHCYNY